MVNVVNNVQSVPFRKELDLHRAIRVLVVLKDLIILIVYLVYLVISRQKEELVNNAKEIHTPQF